MTYSLKYTKLNRRFHGILPLLCDECPLSSYVDVGDALFVDTVELIRPGVGLGASDSVSLYCIKCECPIIGMRNPSPCIEDYGLYLMTNIE